MNEILQLSIGLLAMCAGAALTSWFLWRTLQKSEDPARIAFKWIVTAVIVGILVWVGKQVGGAGLAGAFIGPIIAAAFGVVMGILWAPHIGALLAKPFTSFYDGGEVEPELRPFYSIARAKQKLGKYQEAILETRKQLARFPEDYEGWMLLAEIYGDNLKDHAGAQECVQEILSHAGHSPRNIVFALNRVADWHLQLKADREAAREALEEIIRRYPETEFAHAAAQRTSHLTSGQMLAEQKERPRLTLERRDEYIGLKGEMADPRPKAEEPAEAASRLLARLESHPEDAEAREELATVYADQYGRVDLAQDQLEQLIATPGATQKLIARWLNMLVDFHVRVDQDRAAARAALQRVIDLYPNSALAGLAESRLAYLEGEFRRNNKSQVLKLGSYEEQIGLKGNVPKRNG